MKTDYDLVAIIAICPCGGDVIAPHFVMEHSTGRAPKIPMSCLKCMTEYDHRKLLPKISTSISGEPKI